MTEIKYYKKYTGKSGSIVDALKDIGVKDTSKEARAKIALLNGVTSYCGSEAQNYLLLTDLKSGKLIKSVAEIKYYKKYTGASGSIVDALKDIGVKDTSKEARAKIANLNGIKDYTGSEANNVAMLTKLKSGNLIKSKTAITVYNPYKNREKFIGCLQKYDPVLKKYGKQIHYSFPDSESSFAKAEAVLKKGKGTGLTCVVPCRWALKDIGISPSGFYCKNGTFAHCYKGDVKTHLSRMLVGDAIGLTVKQAVNKGLLVPGDIIAFKDATHTFVYTGNKYLVYDGGSAADYPKDGITVDYSKHYATRKISEILRWKD